jgi:hypothetical protein
MEQTTEAAVAACQVSSGIARQMLAQLCAEWLTMLAQETETTLVSAKAITHGMLQA